MADANLEKQPLLETQEDVEDREPEPSLAELQNNIREAQRAYWRAWSKSTNGRWHKRIMIAVTVMLVTFAAFCVTVIIQDSFDDSYPDYYSRRVPLEAHIMSKCPDARDCLRDLILPTMQNVSRKVDFKLSYIGQASDFDDGVQCMHGQTECLGNIIELCAASLYPDPKIYLGFTMCLSNEYKRIPNRKLVEECALEHGISIKRLNDCVVDDNGALSVDRLRESFNRSAAAGVTKSCTVRLNGQTRCIRDGGKWSNCDGGHDPEDLVKDIMKLWNAKSTELGA